MSQENVEVMRRAYEALNRGDLDGAVEDAAQDFAYIPSGTIPGTAAVYRGPEGLRRFLEWFWDEFADIHTEIHEFIDAGDQVLVPQTLHGRGQQSGIETSWEVWILWTLRGGRMVHGQGFTTREQAIEAAGLREWAMSQANVELVRRARATYDGRDLVPDIREMVEFLGPEPSSEAVLAFWAENPLWQYLHPDIEMDTSATGLAGSVARGPREVIRWWSDWVEVWASYVARLTTDYRDLGDWVLASVDIRAQGRAGISAEVRVFELYRVRDGKIAAYRTFLSERAALEAVGLRE